MSKTELTDERYTPKYIFDALGCKFDLDVATPDDISIKIYTPCIDRIYAHEDGIKSRWIGFVWMNPPYGREETKKLWLDKFFKHGDGLALMPDRSSTGWWQEAALKCDAFLQVHGKIKFISGNGQPETQPRNGSTIFAIGKKGVQALLNAQLKGLGYVFSKITHSDKVDRYDLLNHPHEQSKLFKE